MKRVLLIKTAEVFNKKEEPQAVPHGGLGYLASALQESGLEVVLLDALIEGFTETPTRLDEEWFRVGLSREGLRKKIEQINPDFIGISAQFSSQHEMLEEAVEDARAVTSAPIVVGGIHATYMPEMVLGIKGVDYVLRGEAEETLPALLNAPVAGVEKIPGLSFLKEGRAIHNLTGRHPDITKLPYPARRLYPGASSSGDSYSEINAPHGHRFGRGKLPYYEIITSRGCNYKCSGCAGSHFAGRNRIREAADVLGEVDMLISDFGMKSLVVIDDNFIQNKPRAITILKEMARRGYGLNVTFPNGLLIRNLFSKHGRVDKGFIDLLRAAGTTEVDLPVETASARIMTAYLNGKYDTSLDLGELCKTFAGVGIKTSGYFMLGFPDETREEMGATIELAQKLESLGMNNAWIFTVSAFPGSVFWKSGQRIAGADLRNLRFRAASRLNKYTSSAELQRIREEAQQKVDAWK